MLEGADILVRCESGAGYTEAALFTLLHRCIQSPNANTASVILSPTESRAAHTAARLRAITDSGLTVNIVSDNDPEDRPEISVPLITITTPNQFLEQLRKIEQPALSLSTLLITQMDMMIAKGAKTALLEIGNLLTNKPQVILYTARETRSVTHLSRILQHEPVHLTIASDSQHPESIAQQAWPVPTLLKTPLLLKLHRRIKPPLMLVIVSQEATASRLARRMRAVESSAAALLNSDTDAIQSSLHSRFGTKIKILLLSEQIPANLQVTEVTHVVHYDMPHDTRQYFNALQSVPQAVHITLVTPRDEERVLEVEDSLGRPLFRYMLADFDYTLPNRKSKSNALSREEVHTSRHKGKSTSKNKLEKKTQRNPETPRTWGDRNAPRKDPEKIPLAEWLPEPLPPIWHQQETSISQSSQKDNASLHPRRHRRRHKGNKKG